MNKDKEKKKTLTISSNFKSKIDSTNFQKKENKKSYSINNEKKGQFKNYKKTLGCIAIRKISLLKIIKKLNKKSIVEISNQR